MSSLEEHSPEDLTPVTPEEVPLRYDQLVDGFHAATIARMATEYLTTRKPLSLEVSRDQAKRLAEQVRRRIESEPNVYQAIAITRAVICTVIEDVLSGRSRPAEA